MLYKIWVQLRNNAHVAKGEDFSFDTGRLEVGRIKTFWRIRRKGSGTKNRIKGEDSRGGG